MIHPSKDIIGSKSTRLGDKIILLGITSSAAIYKSIDLARELMRHGAEVYPIMTPNAAKLISPDLFYWATGNKPLVELSGEIEHIQLTHQNSKKILLLIAPATANTIAKVANGISDNALTATILSALGRRIPTIVVPAMHLSLWDAPQMRENIRKLEKMGIRIIEPLIKEGKAKYPPLEEIIENIFREVTSPVLRNKKILVTAGSTRVYIDDIRFISNPSSGKMGIAMAIEAWLRGGNVDLLMAKHSKHRYYIPIDINILTFETFNDAQDLLIEKIETADIFIHAAAISDFRPSKKITGKMSSKKGFSVNLEPTPKLLEKARSVNKRAFFIAFKAEWNVSDKELIEKSKEYIETGIANAVVANDVSKGVFGSDMTEIVLLYEETGGLRHVKIQGEKRYVASKILDILFGHE